MKHINQIIFLEYLAGSLKASEKERLQKHLAQCRTCSERLRDFEKTWDKLGQWNIDTTEHDMSGKIIALVEKSNINRIDSESIRKPKFWSEALRVAASIIIAVGIGHQIGKYSVPRYLTESSTTEYMPQYLEALSLKWSSELAWLVIESEPIEEQG